MNRLADGSYWRYGYDALGQVTSGNKFWVDQTPVAGQQFDYAFDTIGNRTQTLAGGDQNGANLRLANYTNNSLNQITSRGVPGAVDVMGDALATNSVTVNGLTAYRKVEYFRQQLAVTNSSTNVWQIVSNASPGQTSVVGHLYVPKNPENYTYDADGNLLSDGRWTYTWDGENRLVGLTNLTGAPSGSQLQLAFAYDYQGRRIQKIVVGSYTNKFAYDGWNCIATLTSSFNLLNSFTWGSDLSGSMQGAGGVGGLLAENIVSNGVQFVAYDGNGNVAALVNATNGIISANYDYGPFGELIRATGPMAKLNPFRFPTKYDDDETDFLYYGYRYYNPSTGRWLCRDKVGEWGGLNLYDDCGNDSLNTVDPFGRDYGVPPAFGPPPGFGDPDPTLTDYLLRLQNSRQSLYQSLSLLCPCESATFKTLVQSQPQTCTIESCVAQAQAVSIQMYLKAKVVLTTEWSRFGDIAVGFVWENNRAYGVPNHGKSASDYDKGYGLTCEGWDDLMANAFSKVETDWLLSRTLCFRASSLVSSGGVGGLSLHNWIGLYGPNRGDTIVLKANGWANPDINVDPWQTSGAQLVPPHPKQAASLANFWW